MISKPGGKWWYKIYYWFECNFNVIKVWFKIYYKLTYKKLYKKLYKKNISQFLYLHFEFLISHKIIVEKLISEILLVNYSKANNVKFYL